jgi:hypothetical protein
MGIPFMRISQMQFTSEIASPSATIPMGKLAYLSERARNNLYAFVIKKFREKEKLGFTKAQLARRIGYDSARVNKLLAAPGNWTLDTVSDLLVGIAAEELIPCSASILGRPHRNYSGQDWIEDDQDNNINTKAWTSSNKIDFEQVSTT